MSEEGRNATAPETSEGKGKPNAADKKAAAAARMAAARAAKAAKTSSEPKEPKVATPPKEADPTDRATALSVFEAMAAKNPKFTVLDKDLPYGKGPRLEVKIDGTKRISVYTTLRWFKGVGPDAPVVRFQTINTKDDVDSVDPVIIRKYHLINDETLAAKIEATLKSLGVTL